MTGSQGSLLLRDLQLAATDPPVSLATFAAPSRVSNQSHTDRIAAHSIGAAVDNKHSAGAAVLYAIRGKERGIAGRRYT